MSKEISYTELLVVLQKPEQNKAERNKAVRTLHKKEKKYHLFFEAANDAIFVADAETGVIIDANRKAEQLTGFSKAEMIGMHQTRLHPNSQEQEARDKFRHDVKHGGNPLHKNIQVVHRDGHTIPVEISPSIFEMEGRQFVFGIFRDVTERKKAQEDLQNAYDELAETNAALKVLLKRREEDKKEDKKEMEQMIFANYEILVLPFLNRLKNKVSDRNDQHLLHILESNIHELLSPFSKKLADPLKDLSPAELQICNMIKQGFSSKEMADLLNISVKTVETHRTGIRKKLGLQNTKINLHSFLSTL